MKLRVYRTFSWEVASGPYDTKIGGPNPMKLVAHDELQFYYHGAWYPVDVVEEEKPLNPQDELSRLCEQGIKDELAFKINMINSRLKQHPTIIIPIDEKKDAEIEEYFKNLEKDDEM